MTLFPTTEQLVVSFTITHDEKLDLQGAIVHFAKELPHINSEIDDLEDEIKQLRANLKDLKAQRDIISQKQGMLSEFTEKGIITILVDVEENTDLSLKVVEQTAKLFDEYEFFISEREV